MSELDAICQVCGLCGHCIIGIADCFSDGSCIHDTCFKEENQYSELPSEKLYVVDKHGKLIKYNMNNNDHNNLQKFVMTKKGLESYNGFMFKSKTKNLKNKKSKTKIKKSNSKTKKSKTKSK